MGQGNFEKFCDDVNETMMKEVVDKTELDKRCKNKKLDKARNMV